MKRDGLDPDGWGNLIPALVLLCINLLVLGIYKLTGVLVLQIVALALDAGAVYLYLHMMFRRELRPAIGITGFLISLTAAVMYILFYLTAVRGWFSIF